MSELLQAAAAEYRKAFERCARHFHFAQRLDGAVPHTVRFEDCPADSCTNARKALGLDEPKPKTFPPVSLVRSVRVVGGCTVFNIACDRSHDEAAAALEKFLAEPARNGHGRRLFVLYCAECRPAWVDGVRERNRA